MGYKYLFGPIPSRRLGISLGVDLVPHKVCNLNCIYCESGKTTAHTNTRKEYIPTKDIIAELDDYLSEKPELDYITFSGAGEPTLHSGIGEILQFIKSSYPAYKTALITNSLLLSDAEVRQEVLAVDLILPSLDTASQEVFLQMNKPFKGLNIQDVIAGLIEFSGLFQGEMWLEYFVIPGINDQEKELELIKKAVIQINPDRLQINTLDRPGTQSDIEVASFEQLSFIQQYLLPVKSEIIARTALKKHLDTLKQDFQSTIIQAITRRPCNMDDLEKILGLPTSEVELLVKALILQGIIVKEKQNKDTFFKLP
ncbi:radical SAM protein [Bacteroidota bacterium]